MYVNQELNLSLKMHTKIREVGGGAGRGRGGCEPRIELILKNECGCAVGRVGSV